MIRPDDWLGLERADPGRWSFELTPGLCRFDDKLYGGTGLAVATSVMARETGRPALWVDVQFVASADLGAHVECEVEELARGGRTSQVRLTARVDGAMVFTALGATGDPREGGLDLQVGSMPEVAPPDDCTPVVAARPVPAREGPARLVRSHRDPGGARRRRRHGAVGPDARPSPQPRHLGVRSRHGPLGGGAGRRPGRRRHQPRQLDPPRSRSRRANGCSSSSFRTSRRAATCTDRPGCGRPDGTHLAVASQTAVGLLFD